MGDLRQGFEILALHALRCAISRGDAQTASTSHRCDSGKMSPLSATRPVAEGGSDHAYEARTVGLHDVQLDARIQFLVFVTRSRTVEIHVHATEIFCQLEELSRGFGAIDVDGSKDHLRLGIPLEEQVREPFCELPLLHDDRAAEIREQSPCRCRKKLLR